MDAPKGKVAVVSVNGAILDKGEDGYSFVIESNSVIVITLQDCAHEGLTFMERVEPTEFKAGSLPYYRCPSCDECFLDEAGEQKLENGTNIVKGDPRYIAPIQGEFCLINSNVASYLNATTEEEQIQALKVTSPFNNQARKNLRWDGTYGSKYIVDVSKDKDFATYERYTTSNRSLTLPGILTPGDVYYWRVSDDKGNLINDDYSFRVSGTLSVRTMAVDGMFNMRDLGGWNAQGGTKIPYGKIYRGGNFSTITTSGKETFAEDLGIKTEIDLRTNGTDDLNDDRVEYFKAGMWQYTMIVPGYTSPGATDDATVTRGYDAGSSASIKRIFEKLAEPASYPVYFHCNAGADRTGTLAYLLEGLLGVSYADATKDFELTTFSSQGARYRSAVNSTGDGFDDTGIFENTTGNLISFGKMNELIMDNYPTKNGTFTASVERYLKEVAGISDETIKAVRTNILGNEVTFDPIELPDSEDEPGEIKETGTFTFANGLLTVGDKASTHEVVEFEGKVCNKIFMAKNQDKIFLNVSEVTKYTKITFDVYVASEDAKYLQLPGKPPFAFR